MVQVLVLNKVMRISCLKNMHPFQLNVVEQSHDPLLFCVLTLALLNSRTTTIISSSVEMAGNLVPLVVLSIFLLTETTTGLNTLSISCRYGVVYKAQVCIALRLRDTEIN